MRRRVYSLSNQLRKLSRRFENMAHEFQFMVDPRPYDLVANEYYDPHRHPTCANFREASKQVISTFLRECAIEDGQVQIEVGAGASVLAEIVVEAGGGLEDTYLTDSSLSMLLYSSLYRRQGASLVLGDATNLPFKGEAANLLVSSLGDPFNTIDFWHEVSRVLRPGGKAIFTTPAYDWAAWFRSGQSAVGHCALFELRDGARVPTPSHIHSQYEMNERFSRVGLRLRRYQLVRASELTTELSKKLLRENGASAPVLEGYLLDKA
jgi:ubiquinone/menaquinone biosynthesis C-methylase UbiE